MENNKDQRSRKFTWHSCALTCSRSRAMRSSLVGQSCRCRTERSQTVVLDEHVYCTCSQWSRVRETLTDKFRKTRDHWVVYEAPFIAQDSMRGEFALFRWWRNIDKKRSIINHLIEWLGYGILLHALLLLALVALAVGDDRLVLDVGEPTWNYSNLWFSILQYRFFSKAKVASTSLFWALWKLHGRYFPLFFKVCFDSGGANWVLPWFCLPISAAN